ncbi:hypothetical protein B9Z19DRAFT_1126630 [Tuber borchii]|uniref:Aspartic peptidase domain-containing protein n=1 Tax=Tuber borchii TaxID=42251 RepID=A0A2T6ZSU8_TUBBO|nr:hypothetical protein B9Z19DRAFT_1126630 [Tuber borchii]
MPPGPLHDRSHPVDAKRSTLCLPGTVAEELMTLGTRIASKFGIKYLAKAKIAEAKKPAEMVKGYIYGAGFRPLIPLRVAYGDIGGWVFFLLDSGSPVTYLSIQVCDRLHIQRSGWFTKVWIGGYSHDVMQEPEEPQFTDLNILGGDFLHPNKGQVWYDYVEGKVTAYFGGGWGTHKIFPPPMTKLPSAPKPPKNSKSKQPKKPKLKPPKKVKSEQAKISEPPK